MAVEQKPPRLFDVTNFLVKEQRRNEMVSGTNGLVEKLVSHLAQQAPNRVYFSPNERICRVLFFSENHRRYQAYIETAQLKQGIPHPVKWEYMSGVSPDALEQEIQWWRQQFGMKGDLIENPSLVLKVVTRKGYLGNEFIHVRMDETPPMFLHYYLTNLGPRMLQINQGTNLGLENEVLVPLQAPPTEILQHAHPFS